MAVFNPEVQPAINFRTNVNFDRLAGQPITQPLADKSGQYLAQTAGTAIEGATNLADTAIKQQISKDVNDTVNPIRDEFTHELENVRQAQTGVVPAPVQSTNTGSGSLVIDTSQPQQPLPQAIQSGLGKVDALQSALANGKINDTYYYGRLKDAVTQLRSQFPGYTDYIDQRVAQTTGVNPANAYVQNLMQDINRGLTTKATAVDKMNHDLMMSGYPGSDVQMQALRERGEAYLPTVQEWYAKQAQFDAQIKRQDAVRNNIKAGKADISAQRTSDFTNEASAVVSSNFSTIQSVTGLSTPQSILSIAADAAANPGKYNEAQMKALGTKLLAQKALVISQLQARAREIGHDSQGNAYSYNSDVGADGVNNIIKNVTSIYDTVSNAFMNNDAGLAFAAMHHAQAILDQSKDNLLSNQSVGAYAAKINNMNTLFGPNWTSMITNATLRANIDDKMRTYFDNSMIDARLQQGFDKTGQPVTMKQQMDEATALQKQGKITAAMRSRYVGNLVNIVDDLKNPQAPEQDKINVMRYLFSPEGQGILNGIKTDYTDPTTGKYVPGKYSVFTRLTSPDVLSEVRKMPQDIRNMYKNYMEREAGAQLFYKEFQNLNFQTGQEDLHFAYNDGGDRGLPYITLLDKTGQPMNNIYGAISRAPSQIQQVQQAVNRINEALAGMSRVEKEFGGNVSDYALSFLMHSQVDLGKNWEGIPQKILDAIAATRGKRKLEDTFKQQGVQ